MPIGMKSTRMSQCFAFALAINALQAAEPADELAGFIRQSAGLDAGMALAINDADGRLTASLAGAVGKRLQNLTLDARPVYDGLSAANGRLYLATDGGRLTCFGAR